jgi:hypothetical protein
LQYKTQQKPLWCRSARENWVLFGNKLKLRSRAGAPTKVERTPDKSPDEASRRAGDAAHRMDHPAKKRPERKTHSNRCGRSKFIRTFADRSGRLALPSRERLV